MVVDRNSNLVKHVKFHQLGQFLRPGDVLVLNHTRVIPARLWANKPTGGKVELLLLKSLGGRRWETLIGGKKVKEGMKLSLSENISAQVCEKLDGSRATVQFSTSLENKLEELGVTPLPPYIHTPLEEPERYQTIYAKQKGSVAAPTAGLHFTQELMELLIDQGIQFAEITLHIGLDTFAPVNEENIEDHLVHKEWCEISQTAVEIINKAHKHSGRIIAVGTTCVRALETAGRFAGKDMLVTPFRGNTDLFIVPGFSFRVVDALITNFHLPRSTLLMLVSAFATWEKIQIWYEVAKSEKYRFYSFGDAMFIQ
jgi:S-adenosylmethionine:tRNA ribosyltransferase-isomerase